MAQSNEQGDGELEKALLGFRGGYGGHSLESIKQLILADRKQHELDAIKRVDRFEVIDDTGRAYVKGSIYGSPVKVELSYQDDGRTLKVFVEPRKEQS